MRGTTVPSENVIVCTMGASGADTRVFPSVLMNPVWSGMSVEKEVCPDRGPVIPFPNQSEFAM
jgi:hypothetical protein